MLEIIKIERENGEPLTLTYTQGYEKEAVELITKMTEIGSISYKDGSVLMRELGANVGKIIGEAINKVYNENS